LIEITEVVRVVGVEETVQHQIAHDVQAWKFVSYDLPVAFFDGSTEGHPDDLIRLLLHRCDFVRDCAESPPKQSMAPLIGCSGEQLSLRDISRLVSGPPVLIQDNH
jgi:hypothetical protein